MSMSGSGYPTETVGIDRFSEFDAERVFLGGELVAQITRVAPVGEFRPFRT
jgi:hypothetical protein